jgi:hypothetical protein
MTANREWQIVNRIGHGAKCIEHNLTRNPEKTYVNFISSAIRPLSNNTSQKQTVFYRFYCNLKKTIFKLFLIGEVERQIII